MLSCKEIARVVARDELSEVGRLHLLLCQHCRRYAAQLRRIGQAARSLSSARPEEEDRETVRRLEQGLLDRFHLGRSLAQVPQLEIRDRVFSIT